jgi:hypothetical protein
MLRKNDDNRSRVGRPFVEVLEARQLLSAAGVRSPGAAGAEYPPTPAVLVSRRKPAAPPDISQHTYEGKVTIRRVGKQFIVIDPFPPTGGVYTGNVFVGESNVHFTGTVGSNRKFVFSFDDGSGTLTGTVSGNGLKLTGNYSRTLNGVIQSGSFTAPAV